MKTDQCRKKTDSAADFGRRVDFCNSSNQIEKDRFYLFAFIYPRPSA